jgi:hypothetical protein
MNQSINLKSRCALLLILLLLGCLGLAPMAQAVGPDADGNIPGSNNGEGIGVLVGRTTGVWNTGTGFEALNHLTGGNQNTGTGFRSLASDTNGGFNTATGVFSLFSNTIGFFNTATGAYSLASNISGSANTANGYAALYYNTTGAVNTATGYAALYRNTIGGHNTANGIQALYNNTNGDFNTAIGAHALYSNINGMNNTATGRLALYNNFTGLYNTAVGESALATNMTGHANTALGDSAGFNVANASNVIAIGASVGGENVSDTCYIGNIFGVTSAGATAVYVNSLGKLGTVVSSRRFKDEIKPMDKASEAILVLKPVTFRYKQEIDPARSPQFGLVAEDVEAVNPDLVVRDKEGKVNTVRYEAVNAMLLNEFLKEHRKVEEQQARITELNSRVAKQEALAAQQQKGFQSKLAEQDKQIEALTSGLEKVSAHLEMTKSASQVVSNNP